ncbi:hypothetical protein NEAUS03_2383 [Nematocida ausubeli]|nr:hypothetical protein NEAUS03_2383 [Nematocida ausubeli]
MDRLRQILSKKNALKRAEGLNAILEGEECEGIALVPGTANFQIPEVFLSTKILPECETYFIQKRKPIKADEIERWNQAIDDVIDGLSVEFTISSSVHSKEAPSEREVSDRIKKVLGYTIEE